MRVSIEQDECTGCGNCPEYASVFFMGDDGLAYVKEADTSEEAAVKDLKFKTMIETVVVPAALNESVIQAAEGCPGGSGVHEGCIILFEDSEVDADGRVMPISHQ